MLSSKIVLGLIPFILLTSFSLTSNAEEDSRVWRTISPKDTTFPITLAMSPSHPDLGYALDGYQLFKTTNGGITWEIVIREGENSFESHSLEIDPTNPQILRTKIHARAPRTMRSTDGGVTWNFFNHYLELESIESGMSADGTVILDIVIDPKDTNIMFGMGVIDTGPHTFIHKLYKSNNAGENWLEIHPGNAYSLGNSLLIHPLNSNHLYASFVLDTDTSSHFHYMRSIDGGLHWEPLGIIDDVYKLGSRLYLDPSDTSILYADLYPVLSPSINTLTELIFAKSIDAGKNWQIGHTNIDTKEFSGRWEGKIFINSQNNQKLLWGTSQGIIRSENGGKDWQSSMTGIERLETPNVSIEAKDCLFKWAEQQYPTLFNPAPADSQFFEDYTYRYYSNTNTYLGFNQNKKIYLLQADKSDNIEDVGFFEYYLNLADCNTQ